MVARIGILALQGNYHQHNKVISNLGIESQFIRYSKDLERCDALIIPGGESTTISKLIDYNDLRLGLVYIILL